MTTTKTLTPGIGSASSPDAYRVGASRVVSRYLVIEDSWTLRRVIGDTLRSASAWVLTIDNPHDAVKIAMSRQSEGIGFDAVLIDTALPHAAEIADALRAAKYAGRIVLLTSPDQPTHSAAADIRLEKPFTPQQLLQALGTTR